MEQPIESRRLRERRQLEITIKGWEETCAEVLRRQAKLHVETMVLRDQAKTTVEAGDCMKRILAAWPAPNQTDIDRLALLLQKLDGLLKEVEELGRQPVPSSAPHEGHPENRGDVAEALRGDPGAIGVVASQDVRGRV